MTTRPTTIRRPLYLAALFFALAALYVVALYCGWAVLPLLGIATTAAAVAYMVSAARVIRYGRMIRRRARRAYAPTPKELTR